MDYRALLGKLSISSSSLGRFQGIAAVLKLLHGYSPLPLHMDLFLTLRCNLACKMCNLRQPENAKLIAGLARPELSVKEWMGVVRDIRKSFYFRPNLNLLGGEPSVYKGYLDVAAFAKEQGFRCSYTTNGILLARDAADIVSTGLDVVTVSIDGPQDIHDRIRGLGTYERTVQGIRVLNECKKRQGRQVQVFLACAVTGDNHTHLTDLIDIASDLDIHHVMFLHLQFPDSDIHSHGIDVERLIEEIDRVRRKAHDSNISVALSPNLRRSRIAPYYLHSSNELGGSCVSPWLRMTVMPNGTILACQIHRLGNVRDGISLGAVWNGESFRNFRRRLARARVFPDCGRCCRRQY